MGTGGDSLPYHPWAQEMNNICLPLPCTIITSGIYIQLDEKTHEKCGMLLDYLRHINLQTGGRNIYSRQQSYKYALNTQRAVAPERYSFIIQHCPKAKLNSFLVI